MACHRVSDFGGAGVTRTLTYRDARLELTLGEADGNPAWMVTRPRVFLGWEPHTALRRLIADHGADHLDEVRFYVDAVPCLRILGIRADYYSADAEDGAPELFGPVFTEFADLGELLDELDEYLLEAERVVA